MKKSGTVDLRNRIVGARSYEEGYEPYFFKWQPGLPQRLYDPIDFTLQSHRSVSRLSLSPTGILLFLPLINLDFVQIKTIWLFVQYFFFISSSSLFIFGFKFTDKKKLLMLLLCVLFLISYSWRLHVERGQIYIFYTFLNILYFILLIRSDSKFVLIMCGFILSLLISLRPTYLVYLLPLIVFKKNSVVKFSLLSVLVLILITTFILGNNIWLQYFRAMSVKDRFFNLHSHETNVGLFGSIEGVRYPYKATEIPGGDSSVNNIITKYFGFETNVENYKIISLIFIVIVFLYLLMISRKIKLISSEKILIISGILQISLDILIPAPRYSYVDILNLPILALIIFESLSVKDFILNRYGWIPVFGIITFTSLINIDSFINVDIRFETGQMLIYLYLFIYLVVLLHRLYFVKQPDT